MGGRLFKVGKVRSSCYAAPLLWSKGHLEFSCVAIRLQENIR